MTRFVTCEVTYVMIHKFGCWQLNRVRVARLEEHADLRSAQTYARSLRLPVWCHCQTCLRGVKPWHPDTKGGLPPETPAA